MQLSDARRTTLQIVGQWLWRYLASLWRPHWKGSAVSGWGLAVDQVVEDLERLNRSTERDFLAVGERLMEFRSAARQIASDMAALTELISGKGSQDASRSLTGILEQSRGMDARIEQSGQTLGQVRDLSCRVRLAFGGLRSTVSVFRTLCTLTRIETALLGSSGAEFGDLAAEVGPLSESIQASGEGVLGAASQLDLCVQSAIESASLLRVKQLKELPTLIADVSGSLEEFEERRQRAAETSGREAVQYGVLCDAIDDVVRSVQFHDITRQQVEHVVQALRQLRPASASGRGNRDCLPLGTHTILALQSSQLAGAAAVFAASTERIERDLDSIARRIGEMAQASQALMGVSSDDQNSFFLRMESRFNAILGMLGNCTAAQSEMECTAASLEGTIGRMRGSIGEIRGIEIRIQRIAINATIRATHIGTKGNALNVIADVMQHLALDSSTATEGVAGALDAMSDAAGRVSAGSREIVSGETGSGETGSGAHSETDEVGDEIRRTVLELHSSSECSFSRVSQIAALGERLSADIGAARGGFSVGRRFAEAVNRARDELERIGAQAGGGSLQPGESAPVPHLESLARSYTMQMERDVHESVARGVTVETALAGATGVALADGDLGDNVELF